MVNIESTIERIEYDNNTMTMKIISGLFAGVEYTIIVEDPTEENPGGGISYRVDNPDTMRDICFNMFRQVVESDFDKRIKEGIAIQESMIDKSLLEPKE